MTKKFNDVNVFEFNSTGAAYDACQCNDDIKKGDILFVPAEGVVGVADTWPMAITVRHGELHKLADGYNISMLCESSNIPFEKVKQAFAYAKRLNFKVIK